jgi:hypothetical protein
VEFFYIKKKILKRARSPDIKTIFRKSVELFLKILKRAGHPTLRPFLEKASFSKNLKTGRSPDIETIF